MCKLVLLSLVLLLTHATPHISYDVKEPPNVPPQKIAYLTIDDGPSESVTLPILDILHTEDVKATFFVLPYEGVDHIYKRILREGHAMGNHSYTHDYKRLYSSADDGLFFRADIERADAWLKKKFSHETKLFRFPGGSQSWNTSVIARRREILEELGYRVFDWDVSNGDTDPSPASRDPDALAANVMGRANKPDRLIVLMHDTGSKVATVEALPRVIAGLRAEGYAFDTLENYP
ncbi:MAG: polysaccharide deacetylase [Oscillospiraceae bacterium]|nr:polysaccharide deacetylase [Oscillospiraceae bacterium]